MEQLIANYYKNLDNISNDIKCILSYLKSHSIYYNNTKHNIDKIVCYFIITTHDNKFWNYSFYFGKNTPSEKIMQYYYKNSNLKIINSFPIIDINNIALYFCNRFITDTDTDTYMDMDSGYSTLYAINGLLCMNNTNVKNIESIESINIVIIKINNIGINMSDGNIYPIDFDLNINTDIDKYFIINYIENIQIELLNNI
jgi:hypothetical protein